MLRTAQHRLASCGAVSLNSCLPRIEAEVVPVRLRLAAEVVREGGQSSRGGKDLYGQQRPRVALAPVLKRMSAIAASILRMLSLSPLENSRRPRHGEAGGPPRSRTIGTLPAIYDPSLGGCFEPATQTTRFVRWLHLRRHFLPKTWSRAELRAAEVFRDEWPAGKAIPQKAFEKAVAKNCLVVEEDWGNFYRYRVPDLADVRVRVDFTAGSIKRIAAWLLYVRSQQSMGSDVEVTPPEIVRMFAEHGWRERSVRAAVATAVRALGCADPNLWHLELLPLSRRIAVSMSGSLGTANGGTRSVNAD